MKNTNKVRKSNQYSEIVDKDFTIADLLQLNSNVKSQSIRSYVKKNLNNGRYVIVGSFKTGKRGKPSIKYAVSKTTNTNADNSAQTCITN